MPTISTIALWPKRMASSIWSSGISRAKPSIIVNADLVTALTFDKAAGELAGGGCPFAIIDGEGEEILALTGAAFGGGDEDHAVAVADHDGAVGLLGDITGFEDEGVGTDLTFNTT